MTSIIFVAIVCNYNYNYNCNYNYNDNNNNSQQQNMFRNKPQNYLSVIENESKLSRQNRKSTLHNLINEKTNRHKHQLQKIYKSTNQILKKPNNSSINNNNSSNLKQNDTNLLEGFDSSNESAIKTNADQISCLIKQLDCLKLQNNVLKQQIIQLNRQQFLTKDDQKKVQFSVQTSFKTSQCSSMTALTESDIKQLQMTLSISSNHNKNLMKQVQTLSISTDSLEEKNKYLDEKLKEVLRQLSDKIRQTQLLYDQLNNIKIQMKKKQKSISIGQTSTDLTLQQLQRLQKDHQKYLLNDQAKSRQMQSLIGLYNQVCQRDNESYSHKLGPIQMIRQIINVKIQRHSKPFSDQIQLLRDINLSQHKKYENKQKHLHKLLFQADGTIRQLMNQIKARQQQFKSEFRMNLIKERSLVGIKAKYEETQPI